MLYPLLLAGLAASAAGTGMQMAGARKSRKAMEATRAAELARQKKYQEQAGKTFEASLSKSTRANADAAMAEGANRRTSAYDRIAAGNQPTALNQVTTNRTVLPGPTTANRSAEAWSQLVGGNQAKLGGTADWQLGQGIKDTRASQDLAVISDNARGSARILPSELEAASHKGDSLSGWGQLLQAAGAVAGMAAPAGSAGGGLSAGQEAAFSMGAGPVSATGATNFLVNTPTAANPWAGMTLLRP